MITPADKSMDDIVALCKRRGFVFPASEIYGGINGFWDYGPLGIELKNNLRDRWWRDMVTCPPDGPDGRPLDIVGLDSAIIQNPKVWEASGHLAGFADPMRKCQKCGHFVREDQLWEILATNSKWFDDLLQQFTPHTGEIDTLRLMEWAKRKGKKYAPNLALVRNPEVTMSWFAQRINGQPDAPPDVQELVRYLATEQLHATGLQEPCPLCGGELGDAQPFKLMFESYAGLTQTEDSKVYLRPETAQGIFTNYKNVLDTMRVKMPFGIAQVGKSFRNEVTPRNYIFRSREFEQMEMEWFCHPDEAKQWYEFWVQQRHDWWVSVGVNPANLIRREHDCDELAHYSTACADIEYQYPFTAPGYGELEGIAHRGDYDLSKHQEHARLKLEYFDQQRKEAGEPEDKFRYMPHVIEPAAGLTRGMLVLLCEAYTPDDSRPSKVFMKFDPSMAPIKAAIFPLVNKDGMPEKAEELYRQLRKRWAVQMDVKQNIGKRYARMDEAGTPYCFTIDSDSLADDTVTVRDRDTAGQQRINISQVEQYLADRIDGV